MTQRPSARTVPGSDQETGAPGSARSGPPPVWAADPTPQGGRVGCPRPGHTLGETLEAARARLFVGREREIAALDQALAEAHEAPVALCVHGPPGVGKSTLLRLFARRALVSGVRTALIDLALLDGSPESFLSALGSNLAAAAGPKRMTAPAVTDLANRHAADRGLALILDAYDAQPALDRWLRTEVLCRLDPGACIVIASRSSPARLWPDDEAWQALVQALSLGDLPSSDAHEYLMRRGVPGETMRSRALAVSGGRPLLLALCADVLLQAHAEETAVGWPSPRADTPLAARLLERLAGASEVSPLRRLVDAACVVRTFDRSVLARLVGEERTREAWDQLLALPVVMPAAGQLALHDEVRHELRDALHAQAPWRERRWRRRAIDHHLERTRLGDADVARSAWGEISYLASDAAWYSWLNSPDESRLGWRFERGATAADLEQLVDCWIASLHSIHGFQEVAAEAPEWTRRLLEAAPEGFLVARGPSGQVLGYSASVELRADTEATLLADPAIGAYLSTLPRSTLLSWHHRVLACVQGALRDPSLPALFALVREMCYDFVRHGKVLAVTPEPGLGQLLELLQFTRQDGFAVVLPGLAADAPAHAYILDLESTGYAKWLATLALPSTTAVVPPPERAEAAREALERVGGNRGGDHDAAAQYFRAMYPWMGGAGLSAWVQDALEELRAEGPALLADLVRLYYLDHFGTHEMLAEHLDLSRRSYFRRHREALERLGKLLYG